ncbi:MAG: hypothetical protein AAB726_02635 [Patescibacteria group bacterium]
MVTQQLIDYIKQQNSQGISPEEIKKVLRTNGWDESDVTQAMKSLGVHQIEAAETGSFGDSFIKPTETQINVPEKSATIHRTFPTSKPQTHSMPGVILPGIRTVDTRSSEISYIEKPSWTFNIFAGLLFISATIVGLNFFFPAGSDLVSLLTTEETVVDPETARLVAGDPIVANIVIDPNFVPPEVSLTKQESGLGGPKNTYLKFKNEFDQTKNYHEFEALVLKYGSKARVAQVEAGKTEIHAYPPEILQNLFDKTKARTPSASQITSVQEGVSGNFANLIALSNQSGIQGNITMIFEGGLWKLGIESWKGYTATN